MLKLGECPWCGCPILISRENWEARNWTGVEHTCNCTPPIPISFPQQPYEPFRPYEPYYPNPWITWRTHTSNTIDLPAWTLTHYDGNFS